jgi:hypothetical protein
MNWRMNDFQVRLNLVVESVQNQYRPKKKGLTSLFFIYVYQTKFQIRNFLG